MNSLPHAVQAAMHGTEPRCLTILTPRLGMIAHVRGVQDASQRIRGVSYLRGKIGPPHNCQVNRVNNEYTRVELGCGEDLSASGRGGAGDSRAGRGNLILQAVAKTGSNVERGYTHGGENATPRQMRNLTCGSEVPTKGVGRMENNSASYNVSVSNPGIHISFCEINAVPVILWCTGAGDFGEGPRWQGNLRFRDVWIGHK